MTRATRVQNRRRFARGPNGASEQNYRPFPVQSFGRGLAMSWSLIQGVNGSGKLKMRREEVTIIYFENHTKHFMQGSSLLKQLVRIITTGTWGGMKIGKGIRSTRRNPTLVQLCPPQVPDYLNWDRTRDNAVGSGRLIMRIHVVSYNRRNWTCFRNGLECNAFFVWSSAWHFIPRTWHFTKYFYVNYAHAMINYQHFNRVKVYFTHLWVLRTHKHLSFGLLSVLVHRTHFQCLR
jgi:hypothetical protein